MSEVIALASGDDEGVNKQPKPRVFELERGVGYSMPFGGTYENYLKVLRKDAVTAKQMLEMYEEDGQAKSLFRIMTLPIRAAMKNASFVAAEGGEAEAEFITQMFTLPPNSGGMTVPFERIMAQILKGIFTGFSAFEQVYWSPTVGPLKGKITLKKLGYRPPDGVTFLVDDGGHWTGIRQQVIFNGRMQDVFIPREDVFYWASQEEDRVFYGKSYFTTAYYHWDRKLRLEFMMNLAAQRSAVGFRIGKYTGNPTKADKEDFAIMLENMSFAQAAMVPNDWVIESLKEGGTFDFLAAISYHNSQMSKSVLAQFIDDNQGTSANTTPMVDFGQKTDEFFTLMLRTIMGDVAAAINHYIIPKFIDWNFDSGKYPRYQWGSFTDEQLEAIRYLFMAMATVGPDMLNATEETFRALEKKVVAMYGLDVDWAAVEKRLADVKAAADKLAAQPPTQPQNGQPPPNGNGLPTGPGQPPNNGQVLKPPNPFHN